MLVSLHSAVLSSPLPSQGKMVPEEEEIKSQLHKLGDEAGLFVVSPIFGRIFPR